MRHGGQVHTFTCMCMGGMISVYMACQMCIVVIEKVACYLSSSILAL